MPGSPPTLPPVRCKLFRIDNLQFASLISKNTGIPQEEVLTVINRTNPEPLNLDEEKYKILGMQNKKDRLIPPDEAAGFKKETSVSMLEFDRFVHQVWRFRPGGTKAHPNDNLVKIAEFGYSVFHGNSPLFERPEGTPNDVPPHELTDIIIENRCLPYKDTDSTKYNYCLSLLDYFCHDPDTCNTLEFSSKECSAYPGFAGLKYPSRETNVDAPERGYIPDTPEAKKFCLDILFGIRPTEEAPYPINQKQVGNAAEVLRAMVPNWKTADPSELFKAMQLIATWMDYGSWVGTVAANLFTDRAYQNDVYFKSRSSTIRFASEKVEGESDDAPIGLCGMKQPSDPYLRGIVAFLARFIDSFKTSVFIHDYVKNQLGNDLKLIDDSVSMGFASLPKQAYNELEQAIRMEVEKYKNSGLAPDLSLIEYLESTDNAYQNYLELNEDERFGFAETSTGKKRAFKFSDYRYFIRFRSTPLTSSQNQEIRHLAGLLNEKNLSSPSEIYKSIASGWPKITAFFDKHPEYKDNWTVWKVALGIVMPYQKYRTQDFAIFDEAGQVARDNKIGLWRFDTTFNLKWEINKKIPRNNRKDCLEKRSRGGIHG